MLHDYLSLCLEGMGCVVFYTHGSVDYYGDYVCDVKPISNECGTGDRCSCAIGHVPIPIMDTSSTRLLSQKYTYGATACFLGSIFGQKAVSDGAQFFIGYADEFWHMPYNEAGQNPFSDIVNSVVILMLEGRPGKEIVTRLRERYNKWLTKQWNPIKQPKDWWLIEICLQNNIESLTLIPD